MVSALWRHVSHRGRGCCPASRHRPAAGRRGRGVRSGAPARRGPVEVGSRLIPQRRSTLCTVEGTLPICEAIATGPAAASTQVHDLAQHRLWGRVGAAVRAAGPVAHRRSFGAACSRSSASTFPRSRGLGPPGGCGRGESVLVPALTAGVPSGRGRLDLADARRGASSGANRRPTLQNVRHEATTVLQEPSELQ